MGILDAPVVPKDKNGRRLDSFAVADAIRVTNPISGLVSVAHRVGLGNSWSSNTGVSLSDGTATVETSRVTLVATEDATGLRLVYANVANGIAGVNDITVTAEVNITAIGFIPARFGGRKTVTIEPGAYAVSDPIPVQITKGLMFATRQCVTVASAGMKWPTNTPTIGQLDMHWASDFTRQINNAGATATFMKRLYSPSAVVGVATNLAKPPLTLIGDSIMSGYGDSESGTLPLGQPGWIHRKLAQARSCLDLSVSGSTADILNAQNGPRFNRAAFFDATQRVLYGLGRNDIGNGANLATVQASTLAYWAAIRSRIAVDLVCHTITPKSASTDAWATTANQTTDATEPVRVAFNAWIRDGSPITSATGTAAAVGATTGVIRAGQAGHPLWVQAGHATLAKGYIELADLVEPSRDAGKWKAGWSGDGTHPNATGYAGMASAVDLGNF